MCERLLRVKEFILTRLCVKDLCVCERVLCVCVTMLCDNVA